MNHYDMAQFRSNGYGIDDVVLNVRLPGILRSAGCFIKYNRARYRTYRGEEGDMKVLVACEFSGTVRNAFAQRGHEVMSCDLLETETPCLGNSNHYKGNVFDLLNNKYGWTWDLMIAHPPCTYLCSSGLHWNKRRPERERQTEAALEFVRLLMDAPIERIAIENPIGCISSRIRKPDQIIHPWQFGHPESKATCLWLKNLPLLKWTDVLTLPMDGRWENQTASGQNKLPPSDDRWKLRSKTYQGIAEAMAEQWGSLARQDVEP